MARPLLDIHCITEASCEYPVAVRIAMDDGTVQTYNLECKQEDPRFLDAMSCLERMFECIDGYKPKQRRNRAHRRQR